MPAVQTIDVREFIDVRGLSRVQTLVIALCALVVTIDGLDTAVIGFIAPAIRAEWGLRVADLGPLLAASLVGLMIGALAIGPLADRHGRKTMLVWSMLLFGAASIAAASSTDLHMLTWLRLLTGLGLGGAMPMTITLTSEYCPQARRSSLVTLMFCGFTIGSALGGLIAAQVLARHGWRPMLVIGGVAPLALAPVLWWMLPESVSYLVAQGENDPRVAAILSRIAPDADLADARFIGPARANAAPVRQLLRGPLLPGTLLLWLAFFMSLLIVYLLSSWMPTLIEQSGMSLGTAARIAAMFQVGGTAGAIIIGRVMDRVNPHWVLAVAYAAGGVCIILISLSAATVWWLSFAVFGAGFLVSGGQVGANALSADYYPTAYRATGVSWANAVGRSGSIVGSLLGGVMLGMGWRVTTVYAMVAIPAVVAGAALAALGVIRTRRGNGPRSSE